MKIGDYKFNLQELAGATGDYGTLIPLAIGYIVVCGLDPTGFLVMRGIANIIRGLYFKIPMPIEPMKAFKIFDFECPKIYDFRRPLQFLQLHRIGIHR